MPNMSAAAGQARLRRGTIVSPSAARSHKGSNSRADIGTAPASARSRAVPDNGSGGRIVGAAPGRRMRPVSAETATSHSSRWVRARRSGSVDAAVRWRRRSRRREVQQHRVAVQGDPDVIRRERNRLAGLFTGGKLANQIEQPDSHIGPWPWRHRQRQRRRPRWRVEGFPCRRAFLGRKPPQSARAGEIATFGRARLTRRRR